tara:strand:+ start:86 stop:2605 length:2520 start_codon:yes stop_codon:yes gene_type:complete
MSTIKISELATSAISLTDFFAKADASGLANKNTMQGLSNFLNTVGTLAYRGVLLAADAAVTLDGIYVAGDSGTYTNNGGLVITLSNKIVLISVIGTQTVFEKVEIPVTIAVNGIIESGNTNAVSGNNVYEKVITFDVDNTIKYVKDDFVDGSYINGSGVEVSAADWSATDFIPMLPADLIWKDYGYINAAVITVIFYDSSQNFISVIPQVDDVVGFFYDIPPTTAFVRFSKSKASSKTIFIGSKVEVNKNLYDTAIKVEDNLLSSVNRDSTLNTDNVVKYRKEIFIDGSYINGSGVEISSADWSATDFIPFTDDNILYKNYGYINSSVITVVFYDSSQNFISVIPQVDDVIGIFGEIPNGTAYIRMSNSRTIGVLVYVSTKQLARDRVFNNYMNDLSSESQVFNTDNIAEYDVNSFISGSYINPSGNEVASNDWASTDFIPILETDLLYINFGYQNASVMSLVFYDASQTLLYTPSQAEQVVGIYRDIPLGAKYIRSSRGNGGTPKIYISDKQDVSERLIEDYDVRFLDPILTSNILTLGDSITARGEYQTDMNTILSPNSLINKGVSGRRTYQMIYDRIDINTGSNLLIEPSVLQSFDIIQIGGHANDYGLSVPIGTIDDSIGIKEIDTLTVTSSATSSGDLIITLNSLTTFIPVIIGDTINEIATKIRDTLFSNWGLTGTTSKAIFTKRVGEINATPTFSGGTTGVTGSFIVTTAGVNRTSGSFYAETMFAVNYLLENAPSVRIIAFGGLQYEGYGYTPWGAPNANGYTEKDYEDAWRLICQKYSIPFVELYNEGGVNSINSDTFYSGGDYIHPNTSFGMKRMAELFSSKIKEITLI